MAITTLAKYADAFARLNRNPSTTRGAAPHKPILLLAILSEIDAGRVSGNLVPLTAELVAAFHSHWTALVPTGSGRQPRMSYPVRYLQGDGFWTLVKDGVPVTVATRHEPTLSQLVGLCDGGRFADDLLPLLAHPMSRAVLRQVLRDTYFPDGNVPTAAVDEYLYAQAETLKQQAQARFKKTVREVADDGYFVRHHLFPKVVRSLYAESCCACDLSARLGGASLIEAAHILPFADFHNDDPRNGLALCRNHHWGFDNGAWSVDSDTRIVLSPQLRGAGFVEPGRPLTQPADAQFHPEPEALAWHRSRWGL